MGPADVGVRVSRYTIHNFLEKTNTYIERVKKIGYSGTQAHAGPDGSALAFSGVS